MPTTPICAHYGVLASFGTHGTSLLLQREIEAGYPVGTGFLHHGPSQSPRGGHAVRYGLVYDLSADLKLLQCAEHFGAVAAGTDRHPSGAQYS